MKLGLGLGYGPRKKRVPQASQSNATIGGENMTIGGENVTIQGAS